MKITNKKISDLIEAEYNPRELTESQHEDLYNSLDKFGIVDPIIVNSNPERKNFIIGGHQRMNIWKGMGHKTIPCVEIELNEEDERELNIRLNKNTGQWDMDILANNFEIGDLLGYGFQLHELSFFEPEEEPTPMPEPQSGEYLTIGPLNESQSAQIQKFITDLDEKIKVKSEHK